MNYDNNNNNTSTTAIRATNNILVQFDEVCMKTRIYLSKSLKKNTRELNNCARIDENDDKVIDDNNENIHVMTKKLMKN